MENSFVLPSPPAAGRRPSFRSGYWLAALGFAPLLVIFFFNLWSRPHYRFFPLAIVGALFLLWKRDRLQTARSPGDWRFTAALAVVSVLLLAIATVIFSPWLSAIAALLAFFAGLWHRGGAGLLRVLAGPLTLLLLVIPPPFNWDETLTLQLREIAVSWGSRALDLSSVTHALNGSVIDIPHHRLFIAEACTGINSVLFIVAGSLFYGMFRERSLLQQWISIPLNICFVMLGNVSRIVFTAIALDKYGVDLLTGWGHELIGAVLFITYVALVFSLDAFLVVFFTKRAVRRRSRRSQMARTLAPATPSFPRRLAYASALLLALIGLAQLGHAMKRRTEVASQLAFHQGERMEFSLPDQIGEWKRVEGRDASVNLELVGIFSRTWEYRRGPVIVSVAIDYPFSTYHDLTVCYRKQGWDLLNEDVIGASGANQPFIEAGLKKRNLISGTVWFSHVDSTGEWVGNRQGIWKRFNSSQAARPPCYQIQLLFQSFQTLPAQDKAQLIAFFKDARKLLTQQVLGRAKL